MIMSSKQRVQCKHPCAFNMNVGSVLTNWVECEWEIWLLTLPLRHSITMQKALELAGLGSNWIWSHTIYVFKHIPLLPLPSSKYMVDSNS